MIFNNPIKKNFKDLISSIVESSNFPLIALFKLLEEEGAEPENHFLKNKGARSDLLRKENIISRFASRPEKFLTLIITERCNLRCAYCLRDAKDSGKELPFPILKRLILSAYRIGIKHFSITGGEFFIYPYWKKLIEILGPLKASIFIETNGYNLKKDDIIFIKNTLKEQEIRFLVSLDSYKFAVHDKLRGSGTFEKAVSAIKLLCRYNIPVETNTVLNPFNFMDEKDLLKYIEFNKKLGVTEVVLDETVKLGRAKDQRFLLSLNQRRKMNQILFKHNYFREETKIKVRSGPFNEVPNFRPCPRLGSEISASPYGLHPCVFHTYTLQIGDFSDFEGLLCSDFWRSLYWIGIAMQACFKKQDFFSCSDCIKYLPQFVSLIQKDIK